MFVKRSLVTMGVAAVLTACGGGGSSSGDAASNNVTISGTAIKGPLSRAKISVYKTTADGQRGDLLKEAESDDNGKYSVTVSGYSGVVLVIASVEPGVTKMYDEATGQTITPTAGFNLRASFAVENGKPFSAQINPFTDLAAAKALAKTGGLTTANVAQANTDMAAILTFNPLTTTAVFDANNKPTDKASAALTALSQMALSGELGCATGDQAAKVACVTTALSEKGLTDATGVQSALQTTINVVNDNAGLTTLTLADASGTATAPATTTPLEQTKAFMSALRSNAQALNATDLSLQTELQKVADDLRDRTAPIAKTNVLALNVARLGVQFWNDVIKGSAPFVQGQSFAMNNQFFGGCSFYQDDAYLIDATSKENAKYVACGAASEFIPAIDANGVSKSCTAVGEWCDTHWSYRVRLHPDATDANKFTVYSQTREAKRTAKTIVNSFPTAYNEARTHYGAAFPGNVSSLVAQRDSSGKVTSLNLAGELSPAFSIKSNWTYEFDSTLNQWVSKPNAVATVLGDKHNIALSAALSKVGDLDKLAISGSIDLIKTGALETRVELAEGSYLQAKPDANGGYELQDGSQELLLKFKGSTATSALTGDLKIGAFKLDASGTSYIPTLVSFNGSVQRNGVPFFEGALTGEALNHATFNSSLPRSATNVQSTRVGFAGKVTIVNRPVLNVSLSVVYKDTGSSTTNSTELGGQYVQGLITVNVSGTKSAMTHTVTLESTSGVKLVIDQSKTTYPLTKNGEAVGEYSPTDSRVTYSDSTYEQF